MNNSNYQPDPIRGKVISDQISLETQKGNTKRADMLVCLLIEAWAGHELIIRATGTPQEYEELIAFIDEEVRKRKQP